MRRILKLIFSGSLIMFMVSSICFAGEIDLLLQKLVEKGILTPGEAQQIKTETQEQIKKEIAEGRYASLPQWIQNMKLKGDLRLRYQYKHEKASTNPDDVHIGRVRTRLGLETKVNEKLKAGIGIATNSGGDPRSTNISFGGFSPKMEIRLDYAYAKYMALPWLDITAGKMLLSDVLWEPIDLIWDTDITPEGAVFSLNKNFNPNFGLFLNKAVMFGGTDTSTEADPIMLYMIQPGLNYKLNDYVSLKGAFAFYSWQNVKGKEQPTAGWYKRSNSYKRTGKGTSTSPYKYYWKYNYSLITPALELTINEPFKAIKLNVERLKFFGEYLNNPMVSDKNSGFGFGFQLGHDKIQKWADWQFRYIYTYLGKDAVLDVSPDSDRYSGKTGIRGHEMIFTFGLGKNTFLGIDVYRSWSEIGAKNPETLVQIDWNLRF